MMLTVLYILSLSIIYYIIKEEISIIWEGIKNKERVRRYVLILTTVLDFSSLIQLQTVLRISRLYGHQTTIFHIQLLEHPARII